MSSAAHYHHVQFGILHFVFSKLNIHSPSFVLYVVGVVYMYFIIIIEAGTNEILDIFYLICTNEVRKIIALQRCLGFIMCLHLFGQKSSVNREM